MATVTICSDFGAPQNKVCHCFHSFTIYCHEVMGPDAMTSIFWTLSTLLYSKIVYLLQQRLYSQSYGFSSSHVWMWKLDHKKGWVLNNWCFTIVIQEKMLATPLDCKEIKSVNPKDISPEFSLEVLMLKLKLQYSGHLLDGKSQLTGKDLDAGKDWR